MAPTIVTITLPAAPEYVRLARLVSADVASRAGLDVEEIDDLRIAVSELCGMLSTGEGAPIALRFDIALDCIVVEGHAEGKDAIEYNDLTRAIIDAVVDEHELLRMPEGVGFRMIKRSHRSDTRSSG